MDCVVVVGVWWNGSGDRSDLDLDPNLIHVLSRDEEDRGGMWVVPTSDN